MTDAERALKLARDFGHTVRERTRPEKGDHDAIAAAFLKGLATTRAGHTLQQEAEEPAWAPLDDLRQVRDCLLESGYSPEGLVVATVRELMDAAREVARG